MTCSSFFNIFFSSSGGIVFNSAFNIGLILMVNVSVFFISDIKHPYFVFFVYIDSFMKSVKLSGMNGSSTKQNRGRAARCPAKGLLNLDSPSARQIVDALCLIFFVMKDGNPIRGIGDSAKERSDASGIPAVKILLSYGIFLIHAITAYRKTYLRKVVKLFLDLFFREMLSPCGLAYLQASTKSACTILYHLI